MPIEQLAKGQIDPVVAEKMTAYLKTIKESLQPITGNLTPKERQDYGSINEKNKLIVGKTMDYHVHQPELQSPDVNWDQFDASWKTRTFFKTVEDICRSLLEMCEDGRTLHDYDLYQMMRTDYKYTKYKAESTTASGGFTTKYEDLKQFWPNPSGSNNSDAAETEKTDEDNSSAEDQQ
jgi:hypothetical protein